LPHRCAGVIPDVCWVQQPIDHDTGIDNHRSGHYPSSRLVRSSRPSRIPATISSVVIEGRGCTARLASLSGIPSAIVGLPADSLSRLNTYSWSPFPHSEGEEPAFGGYQWGHFSTEGWSLWSHHKRHAYVSPALGGLMS
jgi:hypothetical protein